MARIFSRGYYRRETTLIMSQNFVKNIYRNTNIFSTEKIKIDTIKVVFLRVVSSAYLRLLIVLPVVLTPACVSSSLACLMMYSAYKLDKQDDNIQLCCIKDSFSYLESVCCSMPSSTCSFLTCIQISQEAG